jgi:cysteine desulfurase
MVKTPIYLDNHATTRCDPRVVDAMLPYFSESFGNASSTSHKFGWDARDSVDRSREQVAALINSDPRSVVFTSGATEASNLAIKGIIQPLLRSSTTKPPHIIASAAEHRATLDPVKRLQRAGADVTILPVDEYGQVAAQQVIHALRDGTSLVSIMLANNEIGTVNPLAEIADVCRDHNVPLHCDAVQAVGRIPVDVEALKADLISISAHKLYGPKGVGALIVRRGNQRTRPEALIDGGGHENGLRSGTLPVPLLVGFGKACQLAGEAGPDEATRIKDLRDSLWTEIRSRLGGLHLNGHVTERLPGNLNVSFEDLDGDVLMNSLKEIAVSSGSACTSAEPEPSHVLRAIGRSDELTRASIRFGIGRFNTREEIDFAGGYVVETVNRLRNST